MKGDARDRNGTAGGHAGRMLSGLTFGCLFAATMFVAAAGCTVGGRGTTEASSTLAPANGATATTVTASTTTATVANASTTSTAGEALSTAETRLPNGHIKALGFITRVWVEGGSRHLEIDYAGHAHRSRGRCGGRGGWSDQARRAHRK